MGSLLSYSGLTTKIRAMQSRLLTDDQYRELAELKSVPQAVTYLKQQPAYEAILDSLSEEALHRGKIEQLLVNSIYRDFTKIYQLSIEEFVSHLRGTSYYQPLAALSGLETPTLFDYEMALDLSYFSAIWKTKDKILSKKNLEEITKAYGNKFDLLNLQWIYRSKQYYHMTAADIYALLIPVNYKLHKKDIAALVEAETMTAFESLLDRTYYGRRYEKLNSHTLEEMYSSIMKHVLSGESKADPYSVSTIYCYLYHKEHEIDRLTTVLECIRYSITPEDTMRYISKS